MSRRPHGLTRSAREDWTALGWPPAEARVYEPADVEHLPEPVRRWVGHAIAPGTPLRTSVELRMHGEIRLGAWRPFTAVQRLSADGFVWAATARVLGLPVVGFDRYTRGSGQMCWRLLGLVPVMSADGEDVTRSTAGRHAGELLLAAPAGSLHPGVAWRALDDNHATARVPVGPDTQDVTLTIGEGAALAEVVMSRWGNPDGEGFGEHPFGAVLDGEATFGGFTIPRRITAGWHYGTARWAEGQFIRYTIDAALYSS